MTLKAGSQLHYLSPPNFFLSLSFSLLHSPSHNVCVCVCVVAASDPEQSVQELVYDLRSQCDAIRVTKTVRPYRMVICPVNENNAALTVSDGRVMLWELKAHVSKPTVNPRCVYIHTYIHTLFEHVLFSYNDSLPPSARVCPPSTLLWHSVVHHWVRTRRRFRTCLLTP